MREDHYWPEWDSDSHPTERLFGPPAEPPRRSERIEPAEDTFVDELFATDTRRPRRPKSPGKRFLARALMIFGGVLVLGVILYAIDLIASAGDVPRGVVVAGVDVGGLRRADAEAKLRRELEPRLTQPVPVDAGDVRAALDPTASGLGLDWSTTLASAGHQPLDPLDRIRSFFTKRQVEVATTVDADKLAQSLSQLADAKLNHPPTEGSIGFRPATDPDDVTPYAIEPRAGQTLADVRGAADLVRARWLDKTGVRLPMQFTPVKATSEGVHVALDDVVLPAVSSDVVLRGDGADGVLTPAQIAQALQFVPQDGGALDVQADPTKLKQALQPQLAKTEQQGKDAQIVFTGDTPVVQPSEDSRKVDWTNTFKPLMSVFTKFEQRELPVQYATGKPELSTDDANALGVREVVGQFSTGGMTGAGADNVAVMAAQVNGTVLRPGETFSLLAHTGGFGSGYGTAAAYEDGTGPQVLGGGTSQFATTLYNAAYFAGMADAGHTEHPYYLDRYPVARDALAIREDGSPVDLKFTNTSSSGIAVQAVVSGSTVTVKLWGTQQFRVESGTGQRTGFTPPPIQPEPPGCHPSAGSVGFSATDTRVVYDQASNAVVRQDTRTATYSPQPIVIC